MKLKSGRNGEGRIYYEEAGFSPLHFSLRAPWSLLRSFQVIQETLGL
jgi:hypothetical protein